MSKELIVSAGRHETRVAILEDDQVVELFHEREKEYSLAGSIHKGRVTRVLPGMQSAFVDIGLERDAFLYVSDFSKTTTNTTRWSAPSKKKSSRWNSGGPRGEPHPAARRLARAPKRRKLPVEATEPRRCRGIRESRPEQVRGRRPGGRPRRRARTDRGESWRPGPRPARTPAPRSASGGLPESSIFSPGGSGGHRRRPNPHPVESANEAVATRVAEYETRTDLDRRRFHRAAGRISGEVHGRRKRDSRVEPKEPEPSADSNRGQQPLEEQALPG